MACSTRSKLHTTQTKAALHRTQPNYTLAPQQLGAKGAKESYMNGRYTVGGPATTCYRVGSGSYSPGRLTIGAIDFGSGRNDIRNPYTKAV